MCEYIILEDFKMDKYIYDENNGLWYELQGEYYLPCLSLPPEEEKPIGIWGQRHKRYLKEHRKATYTTLLTSGKLNTYLSGINEQAQERFERLIDGMKQAQGKGSETAERQFYFQGRKRLAKGIMYGALNN